MFRNTNKYNIIKSRLDDEVKRSKEDFIQHYKSNYIKPVEPPCWMSLEVSSFGLLSIIFENLNKGIEKSSIVKHYGLNSIDVLENWFHAISNIRNLCAHHSRLWNRRMITHIKLPTNPKNTFIVNHAIKPYKLYAVVCCIKYLLDSINPSHTFKDDLLKTINEYFNKDTILKEMGFPQNWLEVKFWQ